MADQEIAGLVVKLEATTAQFRRQMADADKVVASATGKIDKELARVDSAFDRAGQSAQRASQMLKAAMGLVVAGGVGGLLKQAEAYTTISNRLKLVTSSSEELAQAQAAVFSIAQKGGQPLAATAELYQRIASNQKELKLTGEGVAGIVDTISKAMVVSGTSAAGAQAALVQLGQAFASGTLRGEELNAVLEQAPALAQAIAAGMGKTVGELRALGSEGKLTADAVVSALQSQADAVDKQFRTMADTVGAAMTRVGNAVTQYIGQADAATGTNAALAGAITTIAEHVDTVASIMAGAGVAAAALYANKLAAAAVAAHTARSANIAQADSLLQAAIANQRAAQTATIRAAAEAQAARGTAVQTAMSIQLAQARTKEAAATHAVTVAQAGLRTASAGVLAALGGPVGLAVLAGTAATAFLMFRDNADEAKVSADSLAGSVRELSSAADVAAKRYAALLSSVDNFSKAQLSERYKELTGQLKIAEAQLKSFTRQYEKGVGTQGMVSGAQAAVDALKTELARLDELRITGSGQVNKEYDKLLASLEKQAALQGVNSEAAKVRYAIEKGELGELGSAQEAALIRYAEEIDAKKALEESGRRSASATKEQIKALDALIAKYDPAAKAQAAYDAGIKLADEALKNNTYTTEQYQKVVQGLYTDLNKPIWDKQNEASDKAKEALKKLDDQLESVRDRLDPVRAATKRLTAEKKLFKDQLDAGAISLEEYTQNVALLEKEYDNNIRATSDWAQWTEGALDRVDSAFADAWRNIGDGFSSFRDSLTDAFKQMLAELAHMAITKPIIMQLGASMGIGNGTQGNNGIWGSLLGGSSASGGGGGIGGALQQANQVRSLYSMYGTASSLWPALSGGYASGGFGGALSAGVSGIGGMFGLGSGAAASAAAGSTAAGYTGSAYASWAAAQAAGGAGAAGAGGIGGAFSGALSSAASMWYLAPLIGMWQSGKLFDQGIRADSGALKDQSKEWSGVGKGVSGIMQAQTKLNEFADKLIGSVVGDKIAAMITGSPITQLISSKLGEKLFGGAWETKDAGLTAEVANGGFGSFSYQYQKKDGGWFGSDKKRTTYTPIEQETNQALNDTYDAVEGGVVDLLERLNLEVSDAALAGINIARKNISTKGKSEEEIQAAVSEWFESAGEAINTQLNAALGTGLELDLSGMQAFISNLEGVNEVLRYLDVSMYDMSVAGGKLAESLAAASGGLDALATNSQTYYAAFFTEAEKTADTIDSIRRAFESADVELVGSREAYRAMVEDIDLTTQAGQEMFSLMMALSGQAAQYFSIVEQQAAQATAALAATVNTAYAALQRSIAAQQRDLQASAGTAANNISALTGIGNSLDAALKRLRGTSDDTVKSLRAQAVMTLNSALVTARAGSSLAGFAGLQDALNVASELDTALYGSLEQFEREQGRTANLIAELEKVNGKQLTAEEQLLKQYETQLSALDQQLAFAQAQLDALNGVDNSVLSIVDAVNAMNASVVAALSLMGGDTGKNATPGNVGTLADSVYRSVLGREADAGGLAYWQGQVASGAIRLDQLEQAIKNAAKENGELRGFAVGGFTGYGDKYDPAGIVHKGEVVWSQADIAKWGGVGTVEAMRKSGPELEVTGPSRIYNASQTAAMLGGGGDSGSVAELRQLRAEIHNDLRQMAKFMEQTATSTRQMNQSGVQIVGTVQTKGVAA